MASSAPKSNVNAPSRGCQMQRNFASEVCAIDNYRGPSCVFPNSSMYRWFRFLSMPLHETAHRKQQEIVAQKRELLVTRGGNGLCSYGKWEAQAWRGKIGMREQSTLGVHLYSGWTSMLFGRNDIPEASSVAFLARADVSRGT